MGPLEGLSEVAELRKLNEIRGVGEVELTKFSRGWAKLIVHLEERVDLLDELERRVRFPFMARLVTEDSIVLEVEESAARARSRAA